MTNHTFVLKDEKAFASGAFENTAYADGALRLEQYAGRYVQAGCYTTPEISAPAFNALVASWNAATPAGTAVELAVRVFAAGAWTPWMPKMPVVQKLVSCFWPTLKMSLLALFMMIVISIPLGILAPFKITG